MTAWGIWLVYSSTNTDTFCAGVGGLHGGFEPAKASADRTRIMDFFIGLIGPRPELMNRSVAKGGQQHWAARARAKLSFVFHARFI